MKLLRFLRKAEQESKVCEEPIKKRLNPLTAANHRAIIKPSKAGKELSQMFFIILAACLAAKIISEAVLTDCTISAAAAEIIADSVALIIG